MMETTQQAWDNYRRLGAGLASLIDFAITGGELDVRIAHEGRQRLFERDLAEYRAARTEWKRLEGGIVIDPPALASIPRTAEDEGQGDD